MFSTSLWYATSIARMRICAVVILDLRFGFRKLKSRRLIFLMNCSSNLTINIVSQAKTMGKEWITMSTLSKEIVFFNSKLSPGYFSAVEGAEADTHDWNQGNWRGNILKSGRKKLTDFCGTCHGKSFFQLVVTLCWLHFFKEDTNSQNIMKNMVFAHVLPHTNQPCFQTAKISKNF